MAASDYVGVVQQLYVAYFGRPADTKGLTDFCAALDAAKVPATLAAVEQAYRTNTAVQNTVNSFGTSTESTALYGTGDNASFVMAIYQNVLGRSPDSDGYKFWVDAMNAGAVTKANVSLSIMAAAMVNTSTQGLADKALIEKKITIAGNFTTAITTENAVYSGDAAAAAARAMLKLVTTTTVVTTFQATIVETLKAITSGPVGQTFTLTTAAAGDTIVGTANSDKINGVVAATGTTFGAADVIVDNSTTDSDTLTLATSANIGAGADARVSGVENVVLNHTSFTNGSFDLANVKAAKITVNNLQAAGADGVTLTSLTQGSSVVAGTGVTGTLSATTAAGVTSLNVEGGEATTITVGQATGGTAAAIALKVKSNATGTVAIPVAINIEGSAATAKDTATIEAKGVVNLDTDGATADQVEEVTLIGNGAAATFNVVGAPTTITVSGSQDVTVAGAASVFSGKTVSDASSATSTLKITTAGTLDLTKVSVDKVDIGNNANNTITVDSGEKLVASATQTTGLTLTAAVASKATNEVNIDVNDNLATVGSINLGVLSATNLAKVNLVATENITIGNTSTVGTDGVINVSGAGTVTIGATGGTVTAANIDASAATGVVTAFLGSTATKITTGAGKDVINVEGDTNFTIDGGAALDTVNFGSTALAADLNVADNTTTVLNNVEVIQFVHSNAAARNFTIDSSLLTGHAMVIKGTNAADTVTVAMDGTTVDLTNINLGTNISKAIITGAAVGSSALTIKGTSMIDEVTAGSQNDSIFTGAGNDVIVDAGDGDDTIDTGEGDDTVTQAGAGNDVITLGAGTNTVTDAGAGNDTITGGTGADTVTSAGSGNDTVNLGNGTNYADGNSGDDVLTGGTGVDTLVGGADKDTLNGDAGADKLYGDNAGTKEVATLTVTAAANGNVVAVTIFGKTVSVTLDGTTGASVGAAAGAIKSAIDAALGDYVTTGTVATGGFTITSKLDGNLVDFAVDGTTTATAAFGTKTDGTSSAGGADTINAGAGADFVFGGEGKDVIDLGATDNDADVVVYTAFAGGDDVKSFEARTGNDVIKFAQNLFANGTPTATLASIAANGTVGANDVFVEITSAAAAGAVDTAAEMVTFLTNLGTANVATNDTILVAANDGADTYLWAYAEAGTAGAQAGELTLVAKLVGVTDIDNGDLAFLA